MIHPASLRISILVCGIVLLDISTSCGRPLSDSLEVESRLPAYVNSDTAILEFNRRDPNESISLVLSFKEQTRGTVPAPPMRLELEGKKSRIECELAIGDWPEGEYKVYISEQGNEEPPLVRGIRKQTQHPPEPPREPIDVKGSKIFFLDDWYLDQVTGLKRQLHPADVVPVEPWHAEPERRAVRNSIKRFWFDSDGRLNLQVGSASSSQKSGESSLNYWAQSRDLKSWKVVAKPASPHPECLTSNLADTTAPPPLNAVYRRYDPNEDGDVDLSQVRIRWSGTQENQKWGDVPIAYRSRVALWEKPNGECLILGDPITIDKNLFADDEIGTWADSNDNFGEPQLSPDGKSLTCYQTRLIPRHPPFRVNYDNNLADRIMVAWRTEDGLNWTPSYFDAPTLDDPWSTQHYGVDLWNEEKDRLRLGYHRIYDCQYQKVYTELVYSRDGITWNRIENGSPFLETGPPGSFNYGYSITTGNRTRVAWDGKYYEPMQCINVLHFMFITVNGRDDRSFVTPDFFAKRFDGRMIGPQGVDGSPIMNWHASWNEICKLTREQMFTPALMRYRIDGWVGALPKQRRAEITTKILLTGHRLRINAGAEPDGFVSIEVLDDNGNEIEEYCGRNAAIFEGDEVSQPLTWSNGRIAELPNQPLKLRITLEKAEIYTLEF